MNCDMATMPRDYKDLAIAPLTIRAANEMVTKWDRHHRRVHGALWAVGVKDEHDFCGAAIVGRPVARMLQDGHTVEIVRVVVAPGYPNAASMLLGACRAAARALGYRRVVTYTFASEGGASLRAAGFVRREMRGRKHRWEWKRWPSAQKAARYTLASPCERV